jgi:hypothetical protein
MDGNQAFCSFPRVWLGRCRGSDWYCFTDVAAPSGCWRLFEENNLLDSRLRENRAKTGLLYLKFNSLSFAFGFALISALWAKIGSKVVSRTWDLWPGDTYWKDPVAGWYVLKGPCGRVIRTERVKVVATSLVCRVIGCRVLFSGGGGSKCFLIQSGRAL